MESTLFFLRVSFISCFIGGHHFVILHNISGEMEHPLIHFLSTPLSLRQNRRWSHRKFTLAIWQSQQSEHWSISVSTWWTWRKHRAELDTLPFQHTFLYFWFLEGNFPGAPQSAREKEKGLTSQLIRKESLLSFEWCCIIYILFVIHGECFTMFYINIYSESCWAKSDFLPTDIPPIQLLFIG